MYPWRESCIHSVRRSWHVTASNTAARHETVGSSTWDDFDGEWCDHGPPASLQSVTPLPISPPYIHFFGKRSPCSVTRLPYGSSGPGRWPVFGKSSSEAVYLSYATLWTSSRSLPSGAISRKVVASKHLTSSTLYHTPRQYTPSCVINLPGRPIKPVLAQGRWRGTLS